MQEFYLNGTIIYESDLRAAFPKVIFPQNITSQDAEVVGAALVVDAAKPVPSFTQEVVRNGVEIINGLVRKKWTLINLNSQEVINKLQIEKTKCLQQINFDDNKIYAVAIGNKTTEYLKAAEDARAFKAAGYPENDVPDYIQSWADAKLWTARQACDDIINQELLWQGVAKLIRDYRLKAKESVKRATTIEEVEAAMLIWNGFVVSIRTQLGVG